MDLKAKKDKRTARMNAKKEAIKGMGVSATEEIVAEKGAK
jgi:hypothetical protein